MSLKTWKREYYPTSAHRCSKKSAAAHIYRKWQGALPSALKQHGLKKHPRTGTVSDSDGGRFCFNDETCAFCKWYHPGYWTPCSLKCPVIKVSGRDCMAPRTPYKYWLRTGDPKLMLALLQKTLPAQKPKRAAKRKGKK